LLVDALAFQLARKLGDGELSAMSVRDICWQAFYGDPDTVTRVEADLRAVFERDPACKGYLPALPLLQRLPGAADASGCALVVEPGPGDPSLPPAEPDERAFQVDITRPRASARRLPGPRHRGITVGETAGGRRDVSMLHAGDPGRHGGPARRPPSQDRARRACRALGPRCWATSRSGRAPRSPPAPCVAPVPPHCTGRRGARAAGGLPHGR
jgi:serine O-acetyltransferase